MFAAVALLCGAIVATAANGPTAPPQNASMPRLQLVPSFAVQVLED